MTALVPTTTNVLKILEPTILEIAISLLPIKPAVILTLASGKLVPSATIVKPIITEGTFNLRATLALPSTNKSAPFIKRTIPNTNKRNTIFSILSKSPYYITDEKEKKRFFISSYPLLQTLNKRTYLLFRSHLFSSWPKLSSTAFQSTLHLLRR